MITFIVSLWPYLLSILTPCALVAICQLAFYTNTWIWMYDNFLSRCSGLYDNCFSKSRNPGIVRALTLWISGLKMRPGSRNLGIRDPGIAITKNTAVSVCLPYCNPINDACKREMSHIHVRRSIMNVCHLELSQDSETSDRIILYVCVASVSRRLAEDDADNYFVGHVRASDSDAAMRSSDLLRMFSLQQNCPHMEHGELQRLLLDETNHAQVRRAGKSK